MIKRIIFLSTFFLNSMVSFAAPQIYHGNPANEEQYPFVVAIYQNNPNTPQQFQQAMCTGTLVGKNWILTARHCIYDEQQQKYIVASRLSIGFGIRAVTKAFATKVVAVNQVVHMDDNHIFRNNLSDAKLFLNHDIALLKLAQPVNNVVPVLLPSSSNDFPNLKNNKKNVTAVGYGYDDVSLTPVSNSRDPQHQYYQEGMLRGYLLWGDEVIESDEIVLKQFIEKSAVHEHTVYNPATMLGVSSPDKKGVTNGDSGGPLLLKSEEVSNQYIQIGVASWKIGFTYNNWKKGYLNEGPSIYVNLTNPEILSFIKAKIAISP